MRNLLYLSIALFYISCGADDGANNHTLFVGEQYAPLEIGQESIYQIDSVIYDDFGVLPKRKSFMRKEVVLEKILDAENRMAYNIEIYERSSDTISWQFKKLIRKTKTQTRVERLEDNIVKVDLIFPVGHGEQWNINSLNANPPLFVEYVNLNQPYTDSLVAYDSTLTILLRDEENLVQKVATFEHYAIRKGLIIRNDTNIETELNGEIRSGYIAHLRQISFTN